MDTELTHNSSAKTSRTEDDHRFYIPPRLLHLLKWQRGQRTIRTLMDRAKREVEAERELHRNAATNEGG